MPSRRFEFPIDSSYDTCSSFLSPCVVPRLLRLFHRMNSCPHPSKHDFLITDSGVGCSGPLSQLLPSFRCNTQVMLKGTSPSLPSVTSTNEEKDYAWEPRYNSRAESAVVSPPPPPKLPLPMGIMRAASRPQSFRIRKRVPLGAPTSFENIKDSSSDSAHPTAHEIGLALSSSSEQNGTDQSNYRARHRTDSHASEMPNDQSCPPEIFEDETVQVRMISVLVLVPESR